MSSSPDNAAAETSPPPFEPSTSSPDELTSPVPSSPASPSRQQQHVHYALNVNTGAATGASRLSPLSAASPGVVAGITRSDTELSSIGVRRRNTRSHTFQSINEFDELFDEYKEHSGWQPGAEPGVDTSKPGQDQAVFGLHAECQITVIDFSQDHFVIHEFDNFQLIKFLELPQPDWAKCRWINVNGLSWDVIQALGNHKKLHRLAVEDVMNTRNRTKVDWYQHHAFLVLTCQKLVRMREDASSDSENEHDGISIKSHGSMKGLKKGVKRWWASKSKDNPTGPSNSSNIEHGTFGLGGVDLGPKTTGLSEVFNPNTLCTLQRYRSSANEARTDYMERHSPLTSKGLAVIAEQVSMFVTSDNTVIAFFEQSADDVEKPIVARLSTPDTILRQSCDASMVGQAIIDAIIDMAIPVASCYADVVGDLEVEVLLHPSIKQTKSLYIIQSEVNKMASFVNPITSVISALRDHKTSLTQDAATKELQNPNGGVLITPLTYTYLGDVYDHCVLITENLNAVRSSADGMIDLIFNTISANQNESMKQLTVATIIFLPLTFLTGYFGQNFQSFDEIQGSVSFFWKIAAPVSVATIIVLMREMIWDWGRRVLSRRQILSVRRRRKERTDRIRAQRTQQQQTLRTARTF